MVSATTHHPTLRVGGMGLPMLDCIAPMNRELKAGLALIEEAKHSGAPLPADPEAAAAIRTMRESGAEKVLEARHALTELITFMRKNGWKIGDKATLTDEQNAEAARCFGLMQEAARQINVAATYLGRTDQQLWIRHLGGTTANKLSAIKAALGDGVQTHLLGLLGDEDDNGNRARVEREMREAGIEFHRFAEAKVAGENPTLGTMAVGYIYQGAGDRTALKSPTPLLDTLLAADGYEAFVRDFFRDACDVYLIEASDFSPKKFGERLFSAYSETAIASGKPIMLGLPTDTKLVLGNGADIAANRARVFSLIDAPNTCFIGSNEEEAVALFCHEPICKDNPARAAAQIETACEALQKRLQEKAAAQPEGSVEPVAFISNGVKGVWAITPSQRVFVPGTPNPALVNNIGAGDALFGGSAVYYILHAVRPRDGAKPITHFSEAQLREMFTQGQAVAHAVVGQKGAQLSQQDMLGVLHPQVPSQGQFDGMQAPEREQGRAA